MPWSREFDRMLVRLTRSGKAWWGEPLAKNLTHAVRIIDANGLHFESGRVGEVEMISYPTPQASATARALKEGTGDRLSDQIRAVAEAESIPLAFPEDVGERLSRSRRQSDLKKADRDAI